LIDTTYPTSNNPIPLKTMQRTNKKSGHKKTDMKVGFFENT